MHIAIAIVVLSLSVQAWAETHAAIAHDKLVDRAGDVLHIHGRGLESTMLGKSGHLMLSAPRASPYLGSFRRDGPMGASALRVPHRRVPRAAAEQEAGAEGGSDCVKVRVLQKDKEPLEIETKDGEILRDVLQENGVDVYDWWGKGMNCGGAGQCLTCLVEVKSGCDARTDFENDKLKGKPATWRLACQTTIEGAAEVQTKPQEMK
eukprot:gnl/TRDRNA2_/TRDRNA2_185622_c0_seq1.p1 gnl/TRDRNA2_/TRDRNA2_185622_c0~~gnl/TRDRNA2_/TRDRNA2_185622_c0_seq1.p1  ORF type:complete len:206 (-),score=47.22 gnl/TRDRNA2_/TRDRNA2_185622_c0_seq1:61-678(-)